MPHDSDVVPVIDVKVALDGLQSHLQVSVDHSLYCPRAAPSVGVLACTYEQWFKPMSSSRGYYHLPASGKRMRRFLQFRLGSHGLPVVVSCLSGDGHLDGADRVCTGCDGHVVRDEMHLTFECSAIQPLRSRYVGLFTPNTDTMRRFLV